MITEEMKNLHKPLQTHGMYEETWSPPEGDRFVEYDASDEKWMRPLGLGVITSRLMDFFDVLDKRGQLIGYTPTSPLMYLATMSCGLAYVSSEITVDVVPGGFGGSDPAELLTIEVQRTNLGICWVANPLDVPKLVKCRWISHLADGMNLRRYEREELFKEFHSRVVGSVSRQLGVPKHLLSDVNPDSYASARAFEEAFNGHRKKS